MLCELPCHYPGPFFRLIDYIILHIYFFGLLEVPKDSNTSNSTGTPKPRCSGKRFQTPRVRRRRPQNQPFPDGPLLVHRRDLHYSREPSPESNSKGPSSDSTYRKTPHSSSSNGHSPISPVPARLPRRPVTASTVTPESTRGPSSPRSHRGISTELIPVPQT